MRTFLKRISTFKELGKILAIQFKLGLFSRNIKLMLGGLDFYRCFEYTETMTKLTNLTLGSKILDIGSSDSIFPQYLGVNGAEVYPIDIDYGVKKQSKLAKLTCKKMRIQPLLADGQFLPFQNDSIDICTAISSIEHAQPSDGDTLIMKEIKRVLKPSGIAVVSVPYDSVYTENFYPDKRAFMRRYNEKKLNERLIKPSGLKMIEKIYYNNEISRKIIGLWYNLPKPLQMITSYIRPLLGLLLVSSTESHRGGGVLITFKDG